MYNMYNFMIHVFVQYKAVHFNPYIQAYTWMSWAHIINEKCYYSQFIPIP